MFRSPVIRLPVGHLARHLVGCLGWPLGCGDSSIFCYTADVNVANSYCTRWLYCSYHNTFSFCCQQPIIWICCKNVQYMAARRDALDVSAIRVFVAPIQTFFNRKYRCSCRREGFLTADTDYRIADAQFLPAKPRQISRRHIERKLSPSI